MWASGLKAPSDVTSRTWSRRDRLWRIDKRLTLFDFDEVREVTEMVSREAIRDRTDPSYAVLKGL